MCRSTRSVATVATLVCSLLLAPNLHAQTTEAELLAHIDTLAVLVEQARVESEAVASARAAREQELSERQRKLDTLQIHGVRVITPEPDREMVQQIFDAAWSRHFIGVESESLSEWTFTMQSYRGARPIFVDGGFRRDISRPWWQSDEDATRIVASSIGIAVQEDMLNSQVARWAPADLFMEHDPARTYRIMALKPSKAVRDCLSGETRGCTAALALDLGDAPLVEWYTGEERRDLVTSERDLRMSQDDDKRYTACEAHDYDACDDLLERLQLGAAPLPASARASLVGMALDTGGDGAWQRLVEMRDEPVELALEYAAGMELGELVAEWQAWVVSNRPETHASLGREGVFALLWILCFAGLAMRSTRWRTA